MWEYDRNLSEDEKIKKEVSLTIEICQMWIQKEEKIKNYYDKRKNLINYLINHVDESENV